MSLKIFFAPTPCKFKAAYGPVFSMKKVLLIRLWTTKILSHKFTDSMYSLMSCYHVCVTLRISCQLQLLVTDTNVWLYINCSYFSCQLLREMISEPEIQREGDITSCMHSCTHTRTQLISLFRKERCTLMPQISARWKCMLLFRSRCLICT